MKKYLLIFTFLIPTTTFASVITGTLSSSQTWTVQGGPYEVDALTIPQGVTLTVEPGTQILPVLHWSNEPTYIFKVEGTVIFGSNMGEKTTLAPVNPPLPPYPTNGTLSEQIAWSQLSAKARPTDSLFLVQSTGNVTLQNTETNNINTVIENKGGTVQIDGLKSRNYQFSVYQRGIYQQGVVRGSTTIINSDLSGGSIQEMDVQGGTLTIHNTKLVGTPIFGTPYNIQAQADLSNNWWGSNAGPQQAMFAGQSVVFSPWLTSEPVLESAGCTVNCNSNIVFIPGLMGSRLYERKPDTAFCIEEGNSGYCVDKKWLPLTDSDIHDLYLQVDGTSINSNIVTKDVIGTAANVSPLYQSLLDDMASWQATGLVQSATSTPYDWRLSIDDAVNKGVPVGDGYISYTQAPQAGTDPYILDTILKSATNSRTGKVTVVAHSNGGLVAKAIMQKLRAIGKESIVDNLVLVAVPHLGTPDAGVSLLHGSCVGQIDFTSLCIVSNPSETRGIAKNMPAAYHLLPSQEFFNTQFVQDVAPLTFEGSKTTIEQALYGQDVRSLTEYQNYLKGTDGRAEPYFEEIDRPNIANQYLLNQANAMHTSLDSWRPASTTKIIEVAGWGKYTIAGLKYETVKECEIPLLGTCLLYSDQKTIKDFKTINGDETVVSPSALHLSTQTGSVDRWWMNLESNRKYTHKDILEATDIRNLIKNTILKTTSPSYTYLTNSQTPPTSTLEYYSVRVHSPLNLHLYDTLGNHTGLNSSGVLETNIPGSQYFQIGEVKTIIAPKSGLSRATLDAYASGSFTIDQEVLLGDAIISSSTVQAIPTATTTLVTIPLALNSNTENSIQVDFDGDQTVDVILTPSSTSTVVYDSTPPELKLAFSTSTKDVVLSAIDNLDPNPTLTMGTSTIILKDNQNNQTIINFTKFKDVNTKLQFSYNTVSRNGIATTTPTTSITYDWKLDPQNQLKDLDTIVKIKGVDKYVFNYKKSNQTIIKVKDLQTGNTTTTTQSGFVPVTIFTNKINLLDISY